MKIKNNIMLQYTISTFIVVLIVSLVLGFFLARWTVDLQLKKHIDLYPEIVQQQLVNNQDILDYMDKSDYSITPVRITEFINEFKNFGSVFRVKIWGRDSVVLWSDDTSIIGKSFPDNKEYKIAWSGNIEYNVAKPDKTEQMNDKNYDQVLEIYTPAYHNGKIVAIVELYEATDTLFAEIQKNIYYIWGLIGLSGLTIYLLLFAVFYNSHLKQKKMTAELLKMQDVTILAMAAIAETRDNETGAHITRTQRYVSLLAEYLKQNSKYKKYLSQETIELMRKSSPLHDIGKVGIPDSILLKPGKLDKDEFEEMKKHTIYGKDALSIAEAELGTNSFLEIAKEIAFTHHEKWDGSGYPNGIKGEEIPLSGRLMAIADVYDALINKRVYKDAFSHETAKNIILEGRGTHFDPEIVDAFMILEKEFYKSSQDN